MMNRNYTATADTRFWRVYIVVKTAVFALLALALIALTSAQAFSANPNRYDELMKSFLTHVDSLDSIAGRRDEIKETIAQYDDSITDAVTEGLIKIYPDYADAVDSSDADETAEAVTLLTPLTKSDDKFLAADATFFLARTLMNSEQYEEAIVHLKKLSGELAEFSAHRGPSLYFMGLAQTGLLKKDDAIKSFTQFLTESTDSPERMLVSAWRQLQELQAVQDGKARRHLPADGLFPTSFGTGENGSVNANAAG